MTTATLTDNVTDVDTSILDALDFSIPCSHSRHHQEHVSEESAWGLIRLELPCGYAVKGYICKSGYDQLCGVKYYKCPPATGCKVQHPATDSILEVLLVL